MFSWRPLILEVGRELPWSLPSRDRGPDRHDSEKSVGTEISEPRPGLDGAEPVDEDGLGKM